mgnify:CR=1 FL=1
MNQYQLPFAVALISFSAPMQAMTVLAPSEDIMTSSYVPREIVSLPYGL